MFEKRSRYFNTPNVQTTDSSDRPVQALKMRVLPATQGILSRVESGMQLDVISKRQYKNAAGFWHIADANTELEANALLDTAGDLIQIPKT